MSKLQQLKNRIQAAPLSQAEGKVLNLVGGHVGETVGADGPYESAQLNTDDGATYYSGSGAVVDFTKQAIDVFGGETWDEVVPVKVEMRTSQRGRQYLALVIQ